MATGNESVLTSVRRSEAARLALVAFLVLVLHVPVAMIGGLISERQERQREAAAEVGSKWGGQQAIMGPVLVVPYAVAVVETAKEAEPARRLQQRQAIFLPERLRADGVMKSQTRQRGIFQVPVYDVAMSLEGRFARPDFGPLGVTPDAVYWDQAYLAVGIADVRAIAAQPLVTWDGAGLPVLPGTGAFREGEQGIRVPVPLGAAADGHDFRIPLDLRGSGALYFTPMGQATEVTLESDYPHPSFQGNWLPVEHTLSGAGFKATWSVPFIGRNYPQSWDTRSSMAEPVLLSQFGVQLVNPVNQYTMAERTVKYASLFLVLTLGVIWLIEVLAGLRVHPIQYLMIGGALCLFYLLELSLSEHLGFTAAYGIATAAVVAMVTAYSLSVLREPGRALAVGASVAVLYGCLFVLLRNEDYALLIGSIGLFAALGGIMYATRHVDWYGGGRGAAPVAAPPPAEDW